MRNIVEQDAEALNVFSSKTEVIHTIHREASVFERNSGSVNVRKSLQSN